MGGGICGGVAHGEASHGVLGLAPWLCATYPCRHVQPCGWVPGLAAGGAASAPRSRGLSKPPGRDPSALSGLGAARVLELPQSALPCSWRCLGSGGLNAVSEFALPRQ